DLGDDRRDQVGRRDVEGEVERVGRVGGDAGAEDFGDLDLLAPLDQDGGAGGRGAVDRRERRGDVEGDLVVVGQDGDGVGADLVGGVAVGRDAVGADHDAVDEALGHQGAGAAVRHQVEGDAELLQLPGGEPRALQERPGLVHPDLPEVAVAPGGLDHAERRAVAGGGERAGV